MDLRRLVFLMRVIDSGSITRAAESLRIAQPALSQHLLVLERQFGTPLLLRGKYGVVATPAGKVVYRHARILERQMAQAVAEVRVLSGEPAGRVTIGIAPHSPARLLILPLLAQVRQQFPDILLHVNENFEGILANDLLLERMDMAFTYEIVPRPGLRYEKLFSEPLCLVGQAHVLGEHDTWDSVPLLLPGATHAVRQLAEAIFAAAQLRPRLVAEIESFETLANAARMGVGAIVLPRSVALSLAERDGLRVREFGGPDARITLSLCMAGQDEPSAAIRAVHGMARELGQNIPGGLMSVSSGPAPAAPRSSSRAPAVRAPDRG